MKVLNKFLRKNVYTVGTHAYLLHMAMIDTRNDRTVLAVLVRTLASVRKLCAMRSNKLNIIV